MLVILSQRVDNESEYADELFNVYHYPARYKNQLHKGDIFIYYQGDRYCKEHRYYFGIGTIGEILTADGENYYAKLLNCQGFKTKVPIYLPDGGYIEQLGYDTVRKSINPPWQSSIRPLSQKAFDYILNNAGIQVSFEHIPAVDENKLKEHLKKAIREYFVDGDSSAIYRIESTSAVLGRIAAKKSNCLNGNDEEPYVPLESAQDRIDGLLEYCKTTRMTYSYKAVLLLAIMHTVKKDGVTTIEKVVDFFRAFYDSRRSQGLTVEKKKCVYQKTDITDQQIAANIISNPVRALVDSGYFFFNEEKKEISVSPEIWNALERKHKAAITRICNQRLKDYFNE